MRRPLARGHRGGRAWMYIRQIVLATANCGGTIEGSRTVETLLVKFHPPVELPWLSARRCALADAARYLRRLERAR